MSSQSSSTPDPTWIHDVFLSFSGGFRATFTSGLYNSLTYRGVSVFMGNEELPRRHQISSSVIQAIQASRIFVVVFSKNYVKSTRCLQVLEKIMECSRTRGQRVVPVFYDLDPVDVRNQRGEFAEAFENLLERVSEDKVRVWRAALQEATNISGFDLHNSRNQCEDINEIVKNINCLLDNTVLFVVQHPVGVQSQLQRLLKLLNYQQSENVQILGIWGMSGMGKTTIAQAIYNRIHRHFEGCCFLPSIFKCCQRSSTGLAHLQEQVLSDIFKIQNTESERFTLQQSLRDKRILLILDDVSRIGQLEALCGSREWFGGGSRIIITTTDMHLLRAHRVDCIHEMAPLSKDESFELLSWHAFKQARPKENFLDVTGRVVQCFRGLPLFLKVVGSLLFDMTMDGWVSVLEDLQRAPYGHVINLLRACVDHLNDENEKQIFLEICCFFVGMDRNDVIQILNGYGLPAEIGIRMLVDRNFVTADNENRLGMHDWLEDTGRDYIRQSGSRRMRKTYDVFLSFRGEDTRASFISHLYASLQNAGIYTFRDDDEIQRGDDVSISLMRAINMSRICVVVLSRNYANSRWCLQELENILESRSASSLVVVPIFYGVDPSEVRKQTGLFGQAFEDLIKILRVSESKELRWREALLEVGGIAGFVVLESRNENEDIMKIIEHVTHLLDWKDLFVPNHPVGIKSRVQDVLKLLKNQQSENPILLGMWGMGGIGKTTIAKAVYNKIHHESDFEGRCFLLDIREVWKQDNGGVRLQEQLLSDIYKTIKIKIQNIESGKSILEKRLPQKRILLVLDDVDKLEQLNALAGSHKWFSPGSIVIITTRNDHLCKLLGVDMLYKMEEMKDNESIELFSWHAFGEPCPKEEFDEISREVIFCCGRLPLALEVLGSHLFKRGIDEWKSVLDKLKSIPNKEVEKKLKISFDGLSDDKEKEIFLDIAFFFIGMQRDDVIDILNGCGHSAEIGIKVLEERSLVTVDSKNKLRMHDLLRDMGREIIRESSTNMPEKRTRLWDLKEVQDVLSKNVGTIAVEGLALMLPRMNSIYCLKTKAFKNMKRLRLLQLAGVQLEGDFKYLSTDLRWLCWHGCPSTYTDANFDQRNLVAIDLKYSNLQLVWRKGQLLDNMKILNLSHSQHLTQTPNFKYLPNLEKLILKDCPSLSSVSHTVGHLKRVLLINLKGCTSLQVLPRSIYRLKSLKTLILSGCTSIDKLEEDLEQMESLTTLMADDTPITQLPHALIRLKSLGYISLSGFKGLLRNVMPSIFWSWTSPTNSLSPKIQASVDWSCLVRLTGPNSSFHGTSSIINEFPRVQSLMLGCGSQLQITGDVALDNFNASNGMELEAAPTTSHVSTMETSTLVDCCNQGDLSGSKSCLNSILVQMGINCPVTKILRESISQKLTSSGSAPGDCLLPGDKNPNWLAFNCEGGSVIFDVPQVNGHNLKTVMLCIVYSSSPNMITPEGLILKEVLIINHTRATTNVYKGNALTSLRYEEWQSIISNLEPGDKVQAVVVLGHGFIVKKTAIYLIYEEPIDQNMELSHADVFASCGTNIVSSGVHDMATDMNENTPSVDDVVADGDVVVSGMQADNNNNDMVYGRDENRFGRFFKLPYLVRAVLKTRPCWFGLLVILVWITYRHSNKRRKLNRIAGYTLKWKWLVEPINKLIAYKKANKAQGAIKCSSKML